MQDNSAQEDYARAAAVMRAGLASASIAAIMTAMMAMPAAAQANDSLETIVVTGTRIQLSGFQAPTPTNIINTADIEKAAQPNIFATVTQLPSLQGSSGVSVNTFSTSSGQQGLSSFSLRGLGTIRTLTLLDGQRVVGANVTGVPDISLFPQILIERIDVVTGGASASYGSDAVGGVVNFITNKRFEGFKANIQGGISTYGDNAGHLIQLAGGKSFLGGRLHVALAGEYDHEDGVPAGGLGESAPNGRKWYRATTFLNTGFTNNGKPQYYVTDHAQSYNYAKYGLVTSGPLTGTAFDANGKPYSFVYGTSNGVATNGYTNGCFNGFCAGGDVSGGVGMGASLASSMRRLNAYGRVAYDVSEDSEIYMTFNVAQVNTANQPYIGSAVTGFTVQCSNPYVPSSVQAACASNNITSFKIGTTNGNFPEGPKVNPSRKQVRFVLGTDGKAEVGGVTWRYDAYLEHGTNVTDIRIQNIVLNSHYAAAANATLLNGQIVCADATARANGCVPFNVLGGTEISEAALDYIMPKNGPYQHTYQSQDVASFAINGEPFSLWAGPVSVAFGGEYRREYYRVTSDPYGNGVTSTNPYTEQYPSDPLVSTNGSAWWAGNYHDGSGKFDVKEAFLETNIPVLDSPEFGAVNVNLAGRYEDYSTAGEAYVWKIGATWETPIPSLRLRAVTSADLRAPNLSELFAAPTTTTLPNYTNPFTNTTLTVLSNTVGNTALAPEKGRNTEVGIVLSRPDWLPGFSASLDYYRIKINGVVQSVDAVNMCYIGVTSFCNASNFYLPTDGSVGYVNNKQFNLAWIFTEGMDIEASYQFGLEDYGLPGRFVARGLATNIFTYQTNTGLPGAITTQSAGSNPGATPHWKVLMIQGWDNDTVSFTLTERWFSDGVYNRAYVECLSGCPASTGNNRTVNRNRMPGMLYVDAGGTYKFSEGWQAYFKIDNLLDRDPVPMPQDNTGLDVNPALYDLVGRMYRIGIRVNL